MLSLKDLESIMRENDAIVGVLSEYINNHPRFLDAETVDQLAAECEIDTELAFRTLFAAACGLDTSEDAWHRKLERLYFNPGIRKLEPSDYANDAYVKTVHFPEVKLGKWEFCTHAYAPYEPFVRTHPSVTKEFREIPQIGYFDVEFPFPAVLENGIEWMTVTPNEINTMSEPIRNSRGRVLTLGLGLGYFAFHASQKEEVTSLTVVERDPSVIELFREHLLPQFPHKEKITVIQADAFIYMKEKMPLEHFDFVFADLWHDPSDGLEMYAKLKSFEALSPATAFEYWIEPSLLSLLRGIVYRRLTDPKEPMQLRGVPVEQILSDAFLRTLKL